MGGAKREQTLDFRSHLKELFPELSFKRVMTCPLRPWLWSPDSQGREPFDATSLRPREKQCLA